eukprot:1685163-Lingulodinium_polyedra.AAC.1
MRSRRSRGGSPRRGGRSGCLGRRRRRGPRGPGWPGTPARPWRAIVSPGLAVGSRARGHSGQSMPPC